MDINNYKVMMIGPSINNKGGISTLLQYYRDSGIRNRLGIDYYYTHIDGTSIFKILYYIKGIAIILLNIHRYDIIHIHTSSWWSFRRLVPIIFLGKTIHKKLIIHVHSSMFSDYYDNTNKIERYIIKSAFSLVDRVVVLSKAWAEKISRFCEAERIKILFNSVPANTISYDPEIKQMKDPRIILFLGELLRRKGVYDLIEAIKLIPRKSPKIFVALCGNGEVEKLEKVLKNQGLDERCYIQGWVSGQEKEQLLNEAYLFVLPSYNEGLPMSILEAMARGTPIISTNIGGIPEVVENGVEGFLVEPGDIKALAKAMERLLTDEKLWISMSKAARKKVEDNFSSERTLTLLNALYRGLNV